MKIPKDNLSNNDFYLNSSIDNLAIGDIELDLSSKPNVFSSGVPKATNPVRVDKKPSSMKKRLNIFDNQYLQSEENISESVNFQGKNKIIIRSDFNQLLASMKVVFKGVLEKVPVVNYFVLKEKQDKIKETINRLNSINNDVDELINSSVPFGEIPDKYKILSENLMKANNINSQIRKEIKD